MGQNFYLVTLSGARLPRARRGHLRRLPHGARRRRRTIISYQQGGTNHTFYASKDICSKCHATITADDVQGPVEAKLLTLTGALDQALSDLLRAQLTLGNKIDLGGLKTLTSTRRFHHGHIRGIPRVARGWQSRSPTPPSSARSP